MITLKKTICLIEKPTGGETKEITNCSGLHLTQIPRIKMGADSCDFRSLSANPFQRRAVFH